MTRKRSAPNTAAEGQRAMREATAQQTHVTTPATIDEERAPLDWRVDDLPEEFHPQKNPTRLEQLPNPGFERIGAVTFDADGNQLTGLALLPRRFATADEWQTFADVYTPEVIEEHNKVLEIRNLIMDEEAAKRRAVRSAKREEILARLKSATAQ